MKVYIFDNGGDTFDRYTIILESGEIYGASENPFHPQGFGQYSCNVVETSINNDREKYDYEQGKYPDRIIAKHLKLYLKAVRSKNPPLGVEVKFEDLPEKVKEYIETLTGAVKLGIIDSSPKT